MRFGAQVLAGALVLVATASGDVGRILARRCVGCHRSGQPGRIRLDTWEQARLFAREIRVAVGTRKMPPWPAVPEFGDFKNDRSLTVAEIETLIRWTDTGAEKGPMSERLEPEVETGSSGYKAIELPLPAYTVPSNGDPECRCFSIQPRVRSGAWIRGVDVIPGDRRVVLHVRVFADVDGGGRLSDRADPKPGYDCYPKGLEPLKRPSLGEWTPGSALQLLPEDTGRRMIPGTPLIVEIRYGRIGHAVEDRSRIRLLLSPKPPPNMVGARFIAREGFHVPSGAWNFRTQAEWTADRDFTLVSVMPAMSVLGTDFKATIVLPDGTARPLVWVHDYDQNWQILYVLARPMRIRAGSRIHIAAEFDNFETNPKAVRGIDVKSGFSLALESVTATPRT